MMGEPFPDPFADHSGWAPEAPCPIAPIPANMTGKLRGRRVLIGVPGFGWRGDLRADEKVIQGSRTYVPVMSESEWYRAEDEQTEVFAPLIAVERVWVDELGMTGTTNPSSEGLSRLVSLDEPPRRLPTAALDAKALTGCRLIQLLEDGGERRDIRGVTELHTSETGEICARVANELDWYRWGWNGRLPPTREVSVHLLWVE